MRKRLGIYGLARRVIRLARTLPRRVDGVPHSLQPRHLCRRLAPLEVEQIQLVTHFRNPATLNSFPCFVQVHDKSPRGVVPSVIITASGRIVTSEHMIRELDHRHVSFGKDYVTKSDEFISNTTDPSTVTRVSTMTTLALYGTGNRSVIVASQN